MDIKRLLTRGGQVFAAEIVDGTEQYKVFFEALGNTVILPALIADGWKLSSLPLKLQKNGVALEDFPKMEYSPTPQEEMEMYDLMGTAMSQDELRSYVSKDVVKTIALENGEYTITTREDFLKYLKDTADVKLPADFLPINYFVHPSARFSLEEFNSAEFHEYVLLLENRRKLTAQQFNNLRAWALQNGLKPDFTALDLVSFYFKWGVCGLNLNILSRKRLESYTMKDMAQGSHGIDMASGGHSLSASGLYDFGLVDRFQNEYRAHGTENYQLQNTETVVKSLECLKDNGVMVTKIYLPKSEFLEEWDALETNVSFNERYLLIGDRPPLTSLRATGNYGDIHPKYWNPSAASEMNDDMYLRAMAEEFTERRRLKVSVSSYAALCESGCSPLAALVYVKNYLNWETPDPLATEEDVQVTTSDIQHYLFGDDVSNDVQTMLEDVMSGATNIGETQKGISSDSNQSASRLYEQLYCAHHIMGFPLNDIYNAITAFDGTKPVSFTADCAAVSGGTNTISITLNGAPIDGAFRGYQVDKTSYRMAQAKQATNYLWVDAVARELGPEEASRHVAIKGYTATQSPKTEVLIAQLEEVYKEKLEECIVNPATRRNYALSSRCFAIDAWFNGAMRGFYTFPAQISNDVVRLSEDTRKMWRDPISGPFVESTTLLADNAIYYDINEWHWYCVNAIIQPYKVMPRRNYTLKETSLSAVWYDTTTLDIQPELIKRGLTLPDPTPWETLALSKPIFRRIQPTDVSLPAYYEKAMGYRDNFDHSYHFVAAPHPLELTYPSLAPDVDEVELDPALGSEDFKFKVGYGKMLKFQEDNPADFKVAHKPINYFQHMTAEDFFFTHGNVKYPTNAGKAPISISNGYELYVDGNILPAADIGNLSPDKYPVCFMYGRKYLVCDVLGALYTVEV